MNQIKRQRIVRWLNIFLLIINVSAIATILLMSSGTPAENESAQFSSDEFLRDYLHLTNEQYREISEMDAKIFRVYQNIIDMQCEAQFRLLGELSKEEPDREYMDSLVVNIGRLHTGLKRQTIKHFTNIRSVVDDGQEELLEQLLINMMEMNKQCQFCNKADCDRRNQLFRDKK
ncbi:MAG: hypothetical protein P1P82_15365 [Bacteroidales bacterium]|nr:hypothetical protein [Bacteroidales bacterium]MDT8430755.1 hypothetical protein [Bacteroidales bacterium]